ncbi:hypothetical protein Tco_0987370 [Tanacetum coccineum]
MEASQACQADKHEKERESLVPRMLIGKESMWNGRRLRDRLKIPRAITSEKHPSDSESGEFDENPTESEGVHSRRVTVDEMLIVHGR